MNEEVKTNESKSDPIIKKINGSGKIRNEDYEFYMVNYNNSVRPLTDSVKEQLKEINKDTKKGVAIRLGNSIYCINAGGQEIKLDEMSTEEKYIFIDNIIGAEITSRFPNKENEDPSVDALSRQGEVIKYILNTPERKFESYYSWVIEHGLEVSKKRLDEYLSWLNEKGGKSLEGYLSWLEQGGL